MELFSLVPKIQKDFKWTLLFTKLDMDTNKHTKNTLVPWKHLKSLGNTEIRACANLAKSFHRNFQKENSQILQSTTLKRIWSPNSVTYLKM